MRLFTKSLCVRAAAVIVVASSLYAAKETVEWENDAPTVDADGNLDFTPPPDLGTATSTAKFDTEGGKIRVKSKGQTTNESGEKLLIKDDPQLITDAETLIEGEVGEGIQVELEKVKLVISKKGKLKASASGQATFAP